MGSCSLFCGCQWGRQHRYNSLGALGRAFMSRVSGNKCPPPPSASSTIVEGGSPYHALHIGPGL